MKFQPFSLLFRAVPVVPALLLLTRLAWPQQPAVLPPPPLSPPLPTPVPLFSGEALPIPPQQSAPWTAPTTTVPAALVNATGTLFEQGLADPRGGQYRTVEVQIGSVWGGSQVVRAHGWVLPPAPDATSSNRFAVCWNGLVYPVFTLGAPADVKADITALIRADEAMRAKQAKENPSVPFFRSGLGNASAETAVSERTITPLKACLLLRLGENELASQLWSAWWGIPQPKGSGLPSSNSSGNPSAKADPKGKTAQPQLTDPYLMLAGDWTWSMFDRAVCAHMRGDDRLALLDARALTTITPLVEAEAKRRGFPEPEEETESGKPGRKRPYLDFLKPLPALLADEERRVAQAKVTPLVQQPLASSPDVSKATRIEALIADLDQVNARQWSQPGGVSLGSDPRVRALIEQGDDAVEPLLDALEHDTRLTRSVHFWRDFSRHRSLLGVPEAAYAALTGILKTSFFGAASTGDDLSARDLQTRHAVAEQIRAYWNRFKGTTLEERWYLTLKDDSAKRDEWLQAAANIVRPQNVSVVAGNMMFSEIGRRPLRPGEQARLGGEVLRSKSQPSVSQLLARRADWIGRGSGDGKDNPFPLHDAADLAFALLRWDSAAALPVLQQVCARSMKGYAYSQGYVGQDDAHQYMLRLLLARAKCGDAKALSDYAAWIRRVSPDKDQRIDVEDFAPLWKEPHNPQLQKVGQWLFNTPASPWLPILLREEEVSRVFESPLVRLAALKPALLRKLSDVKPMGTVKVLTPQPGLKGVQIEGRTQGSRGSMIFGNPASPDPYNPKIGASNGFRVCDYFAWRLWCQAQRNPGVPRCELYWPVAKRDAAIKQSIAYIRSH